MDKSPSCNSEATRSSEDSEDIPEVPSRHGSGFKRLSRAIDTLARSNAMSDAFLLAHGKERKTDWQHVYHINTFIRQEFCLLGHS